MDDKTDWQRRVDDLWASADDYPKEQFLTQMDQLAGELPPGDAWALFERGGAFDSTDEPELAVALYRQALAAGLDDGRHRQATIQLASSLRNLGRAAESVDLLRVERARVSDELDDAVSGFLALALADAGREREAVSVALTALSGHLTRYQRSLSFYARELAEPTELPSPD